jgi:hypothetical protein
MGQYGTEFHSTHGFLLMSVTRKNFGPTGSGVELAV